MARKKKVLKAGKTDFSDAKIMVFHDGTATIMTKKDAAEFEKARAKEEAKVVK